MAQQGVVVKMDEDLAGLNGLEDLKAEDGALPKKETVDLTYPFIVRDKVSGKVGNFTSVVPDVKTRLAMARARGRLAGDVPWIALEPTDQILFNSIVACTYCLTERPDWFADVMNARTFHVLVVVGQEVLAHHERWFRSLAGVGPDSTVRSLVEVAPGVGGALPAAQPR